MHTAALALCCRSVHVSCAIFTRGIGRHWISPALAAARLRSHSSRSFATAASQTWLPAHEFVWDGHVHLEPNSSRCASDPCLAAYETFEAQSFSRSLSHDWLRTFPAVSRHSLRQACSYLPRQCSGRPENQRCALHLLNRPGVREAKRASTAPVNTMFRTSQEACAGDTRARRQPQELARVRTSAVARLPKIPVRVDRPSRARCVLRARFQALSIYVYVWLGNVDCVEWRLPQTMLVMLSSV